MLPPREMEYQNISIQFSRDRNSILQILLIHIDIECYLYALLMIYCFCFFLIQNYPFCHSEADLADRKVLKKRHYSIFTTHVLLDVNISLLNHYMKQKSTFFDIFCIFLGGEGVQYG